MKKKQKTDTPPSENITRDYLKELHLSKKDIKRVTQKKEKSKGGARDIEYTIYESSAYGRIANSFFEKFSDYIIEKYPNLYNALKISLIKSNIQLLSRTYLSVVLFTGFLGFFIVLLTSIIVSFILGGNILLHLIRSVGLAFLLGVVIIMGSYFYPLFVVKNRNRAIMNDLPFVIIHMAAVSGSGAQPISIFNLILDTGEYKGVAKEIRKIVNYVNLFGYDLTTALRNVAFTTPSPKFRELLIGIVSTLETGGDLKSYLKSKADDALVSYRLEREKYVEMLSTYSDIYISVLIAAPLLFIVTLAIINVLGGKICFSGFCAEAKDLATIGTFLIIPFLNIFFLIFLDLTQPGV